MDDRQKEVHISLTEKQYNQYSVGMPCTVTFWALPNVMVHGVIKEKAASPDAATGTYDTKVSLADCPDEVTLGMTAQVSMDDNLSGNKSVVIPLTAIATQSSQPSVWVVVVSYTHLDVYKRQVSIRPRTSERWKNAGRIASISGANRI